MGKPKITEGSFEAYDRDFSALWEGLRCAKIALTFVFTEEPGKVEISVVRKGYEDRFPDDE